MSLVNAIPAKPSAYTSISVIDAGSAASSHACAKLIPSITHADLAGTCLFTPGNRLSPRDREELIRLLSTIGTPLEIDEQYSRVASDLASCGPAFLAHFLEQMVRAAGEVAGLPQETAIPLVIQMAQGTG